MNLDDFHLHIYPNNQKFFIYATDESAVGISPSYWKHQLFLWHETSYYGTFIETTYLNGYEGVEINGYELLTLLGHEQFSSFIPWRWSEGAETILAVSPVMLEAVEQKNWQPQFTVEGLNGFQWKVPPTVWEEFTEPFWEQNIFGKRMTSFITELFQLAISAYIKTERKGPILAEKVRKLQESSLTAEQLSSYFDEKRWNEWISESNERPFTIGLRLTEPEDDQDHWILETVLRSRQKREQMEVYSPKSKVPKRWESFLQDVKVEQERWLKLFPWLQGKTGLKENISEEIAWRFLTEASEQLITLGVEILLPSWWNEIQEANFHLKARVNQTSHHRPSFVGLQSVLDFDWRLSLEDVELTEEEFQAIVENQRRLMKIRGKWVTLNPKMIAQLQSIMIRAKKEGLRVQDLFEQLPEEEKDNELEDDWIDARAFAQVKIELNQSMKKMVRQLHTVTEIPEISLPVQLHGQLRPYQQIGFNWLVFLRNFRFGACLADDMGLGKTIQLITYLLHVKFVEKEAAPALIICPTSVLGNWQRELAIFAPDLNVHLQYGSDRPKDDLFKEVAKKADVVLTSYGLSHLDFEELSYIQWSSITLDEAQNIKNPETKQSRAVRKLKGDHHIALTGTPMENRLAELWTIFDFANHGYLGTYHQFQKQYIAPIEKDQSEQKIKQLQRMIRPFLLRRTKKDPEVQLNLPEKLEQKTYCPLTSEQAALYEELVQDTFEKFDSLSHFERKGLILQMLNRLKQLCNHPALYLKEDPPTDVAKRSNKLVALLEIADSVIEAKEACLIFTQYIGMGQMIQTLLEKRFSITVPFLNGSMRKTARDEIVHRFQKGEFPFFILSLKAGGTGLNLTAANHVIHYDRWWNPAVENQATDRAYRIGQDRFVHVHKFITTGTLEEKIDRMLESKQALNDEIITSDQWITEMSDDQLIHLLALSQ